MDNVAANQFENERFWRSGREMDVVYVFWKFDSWYSYLYGRLVRVFACFEAALGRIPEQVLRWKGPFVHAILL